MKLRVRLNIREVLSINRKNQKHHQEDDVEQACGLDGEVFFLDRPPLLAVPALQVAAI